MSEDWFACGRSERQRRAVSAEWLFLIALAFPCTGCGDKTAVVPSLGAGQVVTGKVVLAGGKPLTKARIVLLPDQEPRLPLYGDLAADGSYTLKAGGLIVGVSHGDFRVSIEPADRGLGLRGKSKALAFPEKYLSPDNGLTVSIHADTKALPTIELK